MIDAATQSDKNTSSVVVLLSPTAATGVSFLPWQNGVEGTKNLLSFFPNCGFVAKIVIPFEEPSWEVKLTGCLDLSSSMVSCEAPKN